MEGFFFTLKKIKNTSIMFRSGKKGRIFSYPQSCSDCVVVVFSFTSRFGRKRMILFYAHSCRFSLLFYAVMSRFGRKGLNLFYAHSSRLTFAFYTLSCRDLDWKEGRKEICCFRPSHVQIYKESVGFFTARPVKI